MSAPLRQPLRMHDMDLETSNTEHSTPNIESWMTTRDPADGVHARPTFDSVKASQARSEFIKATIIFFGLDGECPGL